MTERPSQYRVSSAPTPAVYDFSASYYLVSGMYIEPSDTTDTPVIQEQTHEFFRSLYDTTMPGAVIFKKPSSGEYVRASPRSDVPHDTIEVPFGIARALDFDRLPQQVDLLLAKPRHAHNLRQFELIHT